MIRQVVVSSFIFVALTNYAFAQSDMIKRLTVLRPPEMSSISVQNVKYKESPTKQALSMDVYYPADIKRDSTYPAVVFVLGYPDSTMIRMIGSKLKDIGAYTSWARLVTTVGLIGINYENQQPNIDLDDLLTYLHTNGSSLRIDSRRIGIWSCSGNVPTALSVLSKSDRENIKCAALLYGMMQTPDRKFQPRIDSLSSTVGFYSRQLEPIRELRKDVSYFVVRAGRDRWGNTLNETIDHFASEATRLNAPMTLINYSSGRHAFDIFDDNDESRYLIQQTLVWLKNNLAGR